MLLLFDFFSLWLELLQKHASFSVQRKVGISYQFCFGFFINTKGQICPGRFGLHIKNNVFVFVYQLLFNKWYSSHEIHRWDNSFAIFQQT